MITQEMHFGKRITDLIFNTVKMFTGKNRHKDRIWPILHGVTVKLKILLTVLIKVQLGKKMQTALII